jgi:hypothetical protein
VFLARAKAADSDWDGEIMVKKLQLLLLLLIGPRQ